MTTTSTTTTTDGTPELTPEEVRNIDDVVDALHLFGRGLSQRHLDRLTKIAGELRTMADEAAALPKPQSPVDFTMTPTVSLRVRFSEAMKEAFDATFSLSGGGSSAGDGQWQMTYYTGDVEKLESAVRWLREHGAVFKTQEQVKAEQEAEWAERRRQWATPGPR
jgi:hypothetical protein